MLRLRERETRAACSLATKMRLTQQSSYDKTKAATAQRPVGLRPWERGLLPHET
jgi:hypothetical protein